MMYQNGFYEIEQNINKAIYYYKLSADQGNYDALHSLGVIYHLGEGIKIT